MSAPKPIRELIELCRYAAQHPRLVQGGGGNCSVKFAGKMAVKASGFFLEAVSENKGYAFLDLKSNRPLAGNTNKLSLETPLHSLLGKYVIHTHPIVVAALVCTKQGKDLFRDLFPQDFFEWVEYASPGQDLFETVQIHLAKNPALNAHDQILFLENHGLFVASTTKARCLLLHEQTVKTLENFFGQPSPGPLPDLPRDFYLTPDHVVYSHLEGKDLSERGIIARYEIDVFARQIFALIQNKNWDAQPLPAYEIHVLLNREDENYRQQLWKKAG